MKWDDIAPTYPAVEAVSIASWNHAWSQLRAYVDALLTHFARTCAGLATGSVDRDAAKDALRWAHARAVSVFGFETELREYGKGLCALLAAALGDAELVASCSRGAPLGAKVQLAKQFGTAQHGAELRGLARHLATAAHARLPASHVAAALVPLRDGFVAGTLRDPRIALVAAYVQLAHVAQVPRDELPGACRAWLEGGALDAFEHAPTTGIADGHDPRAMIFEQFVGLLANPTRIQLHTTDLQTSSHHDTSDHSMFQAKVPSDAAVFLQLARQPLPSGWSSRVDPYIARWLGAEVSDTAIERRRAELLAELRENTQPRTLRANVRIFKNTLAPAIAALTFEDPDALLAYTGGGKLTAFKPGRAFRDDWKKLLRYLGAALASKRATALEVEPAWFDFLARPRTVWWSWAHLLAVQAVITVQLGHGAPETVGRELQRVVTGA